MIYYAYENTQQVYVAKCKREYEQVRKYAKLYMYNVLKINKSITF